MHGCLDCLWRNLTGAEILNFTENFALILSAPAGHTSDVPVASCICDLPTYFGQDQQNDGRRSATLCLGLTEHIAQNRAWIQTWQATKRKCYNIICLWGNLNMFYKEDETSPRHREEGQLRSFLERDGRILRGELDQTSMFCWYVKSSFEILTRLILATCLSSTWHISRN